MGLLKPLQDPKRSLEIVLLDFILGLLKVGDFGYLGDDRLFFKICNLHPNFKVLLGRGDNSIIFQIRSKVLGCPPRSCK